jgi:hypothetical protein
MDIPSTIGPLVSEETFDKESMPLTASSSITLRTTSDDETTNLEQPVLPPPPPPPPVTSITETQSKV